MNKEDWLLGARRIVEGTGVNTSKLTDEDILKEMRELAVFLQESCMRATNIELTADVTNWFNKILGLNISLANTMPTVTLGLLESLAGGGYKRYCVGCREIVNVWEPFCRRRHNGRD